MSTQQKDPTRCVRMTGPDSQMDYRGDTYEPANPLPFKCPHCTMPNLDFVPQPYVLTKGFAAPSQISPAYAGNFFVREQGRKILELVVPGAVTFFPTVEKKTKKKTDWFLAVPKQAIEIPGRTSKKPYCSKCKEPKFGNMDYATPGVPVMDSFDSRGVDIFKTRQWHAMTVAEDELAKTNAYRAKSKIPPLPWSFYDIDEPSHPERWTRRMVSRDLYFSVRLDQLLRRAKLKGQLVRNLGDRDKEPSASDEEWIQEKLQSLASKGLADAPKTSGPKKGGANKWFQEYLKRNAARTKKLHDFKSVEKKHKLSLPQSYKDFIDTVGPKSFENVNETEGFTARVLSPAKLDFRNYRRGRVRGLDEEQSKIDGVMFAVTDHGDCFVFDVAQTGADYPVYWYDHEQNALEPFAPNFTESIKRFAERE